MEDLINLGKISKTIGYKGELVFRFNMMNANLVKDFKWVFIYRYDDFVPYAMQEFNVVDDQTIIARFADNLDEESVKEFIGCEFALPATKLTIKTESHFTIDRLIGYSVIFNNKSLGFVEDVFDNKAQYLLSVHTVTGEVLIPFVEEFIVSTNDISKEIVMMLPEGLLDL